MASDNVAFVNTEGSDLFGTQRERGPKIDTRHKASQVEGVDGEDIKTVSDHLCGDGTTTYNADTHHSIASSPPHHSDDQETLSNDATEVKTPDLPNTEEKVISPKTHTHSEIEKSPHNVISDTGYITKDNIKSDLWKDGFDIMVHDAQISTRKFIHSDDRPVERAVNLNKSDGHGEDCVDKKTVADCSNGTQPTRDELGYAPGEERRMLRNVVMVGVVFMVHFTATLGATHLQSSVNAAEGLGTSALAAQYVGIVVSSLVLSVYIIEKLGCKWTIVVAIIANIPYMAAQMYTRVYTLVPGALLMGLGVAPLWSAKCTYLCIISEAHADFTGSDLKSIRDKVIGTFFMVFLFSIVWGNLISSVVLSTGSESDKSSNWTVDAGAVCGANFCPGSEEAISNPNLERPSEVKIQIIMSIYLACIVLACLIAAFGVDSLKRYREGKRVSSGSGLSTLRLLTVTLELHKQRDMLLMVPLSLWLGVDYGFIEAEYTASFVACAWGISNIGYVIICYGLANSALALLTGWLVARVGRRPVLCVAAVLHAALIVALLLWRPSPDHTWLFFLGAAVWGAADGHWAVQINSLYAILFPGKEEAAYSNFRLWQSLGFIVAFSYSHYLCTAAKLYIVLGLLGTGVLGYLGIEYGRPRKVAVS